MNRTTTALIFICIFSIMLITQESTVQSDFVSISDNPVQIYAYLFDQFPQEVNGTIMCSALEIKDSLLDIGWESENITVFLGENNITKSIILEKLNFLEKKVDENDLVFIYLTAHGHTYCRDVLDFNSWFQIEFNQIKTDNKVYLMDSCYAGEFVELFYDSGFSMSSVSKHEVAIALFPEENGTWELSEPPFAGGISSHFWAKTMKDINADASLDGVVSLGELYEYSLPEIKLCYNETFEAYPNIADYVKTVVGYTENYPVSIVRDNLEYDLTLNATDFIINNDRYSWEDDLEAPIIFYNETIYFTTENKVEVLFQISDRSDFDYYCFVNEMYQTSGTHSATGNNVWNFTITISVESYMEYNITFTAIDKWDNIDTKTTFVKYKPLTDKTSINLIFSFMPLILTISLLLIKKRKD